MNAPRFPRWMLIAFALLSVADFTVTWHLIAHSGAPAYEANPVANWWLMRYGWAGLASFKLALVLMTAGLAYAIHLRRPATGKRVLAFGCLAVGAVVFYGGYLSVKARNPRLRAEEAQLADLNRDSATLDLEVRRNFSYRAELNGVGNDLIAGRCSLSEAADRLSRTDKGSDATWLRNLTRRFPGLNERSCLAATAAQHAVRSFRGPAEVREQLASRLRHELQEFSGVEMTVIDGEIELAQVHNRNAELRGGL